MPAVRSRTSIVWLATAATLTPLIIMAALLLWMSTRSAARAGEAVGRQVMDASAQRVQESLARNFDRARGLSDSLTDLIRDGTISTIDLTPWKPRLLAHLHGNPEVSAIAFANADRRCVWTARYADNIEYAISGNDAEAGRMATYSTALDGALDESSRRVADYDVRTRLWYQIALGSRSPVWTPAFEWFSSEQHKNVHELGIGYTRAIRVGGEDAPLSAPLIGVLEVDLSLSQLSTFLAHVAGPLQATLFITDEHGRLLSSSAGAAASGATRLSEIRAPVEAAVAAELSNTHGTIFEDGRVTTFTSEGRRYWLKQVPLNGSPTEKWLLTLALPQDNILEPARAESLSITLASLACIAVASAVAAALARHLSRPFRNLATFAREVGEGRFDRRINIAANREVSDLGAALNTMAANLEERVALLAQKDAAVAGNTLKARLIAHVSHEFRTPLNAIIGYGELLRDQAIQEARSRDANDAANILTASRHLMSLVENLLDLSAIEAGRLRLDRVEFSIADLVNDVATTSRPVVERNGNTFEVSAPPSTVRMTADPTRVRQILINLLGNSGKFTSNGYVSLTAALAPDAAHVHFVVADTGPGIPDERLSRLFEPFASVAPQNHSSPKQAGAGLGLAISRQVCRSLGGEIEVETGHAGTQMRVTLPLNVELNEFHIGITAAPDQLS